MLKHLLASAALVASLNVAHAQTATSTTRYYYDGVGNRYSKTIYESDTATNVTICGPQGCRSEWIDRNGPAPRHEETDTGVTIFRGR